MTRFLANGDQEEGPALGDAESGPDAPTLLGRMAATAPFLVPVFRAVDGQIEIACAHASFKVSPQTASSVLLRYVLRHASPDVGALALAKP